MNLSNDPSADFFTARRERLRVDRFLERLRRQPLHNQARRARFEAVEHEGNALGHGSGVEFYDCLAEQRRLPDPSRLSSRSRAVVAADR